MKRIMIVLFIIIATMAYGKRTFESEYWTGTTTADYVEQQYIPTQEYQQAFIIIHNSSGSETMYYKIYGYAHNGATYYEEFVTEISIAAGASETIKIANTAYSKMIIYVKQNSGAGTFEISYNVKP